MKHLDEKLYLMLDDLIELGMDGLHPIEPRVIDLTDAKRSCRDRNILGGNVNIIHVLPSSTEEAVRRDVGRCIDAVTEGREFILTDSNSLHSNVRTKNSWTIIDEERKYRLYSHKR